MFTSFKDTAKYLYYNLREESKNLGINIAMVSGNETFAETGKNEFNSILSNFAPASRGRKESGHEIDLLIATDCISEGQNLQDCDTVLNYDIHWNPVRIIQRFGRIDRIGSKNPSVRMINYWPTADMDAYLRLENRVHARMALADIAASGDYDPFDKDAERKTELPLKFRDEQTRRLIAEIPDLDNLDDSVVMSDLTLDYFLSQLLRYIEKNREELNRIPAGVYAVAPVHENVRPGVIFFLRQLNTSDDKRNGLASPVHPYYFVYILQDGTIRFGCANAYQTLRIFESVAAGGGTVDKNLSDLFDSETSYGKDMTFYNRMLKSVVAHIRQTHTGELAKQLSSGSGNFKLPTISQTPRNENDFELVTWLVIKDENGGRVS